jgi:hypothetical protein
MEWLSSLRPLVIPLVLLGGLALLAARRSELAPLWLSPAWLVTCFIPHPLILAMMLPVTAIAVLRSRDVIAFRTFAVTLSLLLFGCLGWSAFSLSRHIAYLDQLRTEYPFESIAQRVAYEINGRPGTPVDTHQELSEELRDGLESLESAQSRGNDERWPYSYRADALLMLHQRHFDDFASAQGFGVSRGIRVQPDWVRLPPPEPIELICERPDFSNSSDAPPPKPAQLNNFHWLSAGDFLDAGRIGYVESRDRAAGFQPHAFSSIPEFEHPQDQTWRVAELALVSLLKHAEPRVYETENLPNMQELSSATVPTRPLDEFEARALTELRTERDIVIDDQSALGEIRMLGSLRAGTSCIECHQVREGELLGAFSYRLLPFSDPAPTTQ